ncbi:DNA-3-methyladenine glycosylase I [soil metagenome]|jgi:DNA-3-methyladenine glycosylase I|nr:DNA-3-methyladenine glycosylase I [Euzebyaceae bacterium]
MTGLRVGPDGVARCWWCGADPDYVAYHDAEWGRPVADGDRLFEKLCLEGFQAGLSWLTILRKRPAFRAAFAGFDVDAVARFDAADVARLAADAGIVRNRAKIEATVSNARATLDLGGPETLSSLVWSFAPAARPAPRTAADIPAVTPESTALSKALKRHGFRFVGPTTAYALMQAMGVVNDHLAGCAARAAVPHVTR